MRLSRTVLFWVVVIAVLVFLEVAEVTHLFHLGYTQVLGNLLSFVFALVLITVLALVGAVFVGIFVAHRILSPRGFTPFEEEMLKMRGEVQTLVEEMEEVKARLATLPPSPAPAGEAGDPDPRGRP